MEGEDMAGIDFEINSAAGGLNDEAGFAKRICNARSVGAMVYYITKSDFSGWAKRTAIDICAENMWRAPLEEALKTAGFCPQPIMEGIRAGIKSIGDQEAARGMITGKNAGKMHEFFLSEEVSTHTKNCVVGMCAKEGWKEPLEGLANIDKGKILHNIGNYPALPKGHCPQGKVWHHTVELAREKLGMASETMANFMLIRMKAQPQKSGLPVVEKKGLPPNTLKR